MRPSEPQKGKDNGRYEEPSMCCCSRHFIIEAALPTSIGSGMGKEQGKQVELGMVGLHYLKKAAMIYMLGHTFLQKCWLHVAKSIFFTEAGNLESQAKSLHF